MKKTAAKLWLLSLKNKMGIYAPAAVAENMRDLVPLLFGRGAAKLQRIAAAEAREFIKLNEIKEAA